MVIRIYEKFQEQSTVQNNKEADMQFYTEKKKLRRKNCTLKNNFQPQIPKKIDN